MAKTVRNAAVEATLSGCGEERAIKMDPPLAYAYFPGCSADSTGISYTTSTDYIAETIGLELREIDDWCCCGASAARLTNDDLSHAMPARSLALSERQHPGLDVVAPCAGCYASLKSAVHFARQSEENRAQVSELIGMDYQANADVKTLLEVFADERVLEQILANVQYLLGGMKLACYYGCAMVRPAAVTQFGDPENPMDLEGLMGAFGAECVDWAFKTECCGASNHVVAPQAARRATERIFRNAKANGAEAIITMCPLCWLNLDMREQQINKEMGTEYDLPVYYFTELIAACLGAASSQAGLDRHFVPAVDFVAERLISLKEVQEFVAAKEAAEAEAAAKAKAEKAAKAAKAKAAREAKAAKAKAAKEAEEKAAEEAKAPGAAKEAEEAKAPDASKEADAPDAPKEADAPDAAKAPDAPDAPKEADAPDADASEGAKEVSHE